MLGSISPLGERARGSRWWLTFSAYAFGSTLSGLAVGSALGAAGSAISAVATVPSAIRLVMLAAFVALGAGLDAGILGLRLPTVRRQVDDEWLYRYRGWVYGLGFGLQLGLGVVTVVTVSAVYSALAAAFLSASALGGAVIGGSFGFMRAATLLAVVGVREPERVIAVDGKLQAWNSTSRRLALAAEVALFAGAVVALIG